MEEWLEEFLYRGRPPSGPDSDKAPAFHAVIGSQAESPLDPSEKVRKFSPPMGLEAAEQAGWTLPEIFAAMNGEAVKQCETMASEIAAKDVELEDLRQFKIGAIAHIEKLETAIAAQT